MRRTKIIATIGPASSGYETIKQLIEAGMDVARLNFSHGTHEEHAQLISNIRSASAELNKPVAILQDLQGPKIRTGKLVDGQPVQLINGQTFTITTEEMLGTNEKVSTIYTALPKDVTPGDRILLSDGLIELRVTEVADSNVVTEVIQGGSLRQNQGINLPGVNVSAPALTEKDIADLRFGLSQKVDYVAISFVRKPEDIVFAKNLISRAGASTPIIAKIEKPEAVKQLRQILEATDAVMVARGDLGVEISLEDVPVVQKQIIHMANSMGVPVITATQMLESMISNPRPTRAETSDVANAIIDGTDAVMLSGETANGSFPVEAVSTMAKIALATEDKQLPEHKEPDDHHAVHHLGQIANAIGEATMRISETLSVSSIVTFTTSGRTALLISHQRPRTPIVALTSDEQVYQRLNLFWGVYPILIEAAQSFDEFQQKARETVLNHGFSQRGDSIIITAGHPINERLETNLLKIMTV